MTGFTCYRNIPCHQACFYRQDLCKRKHGYGWDRNLDFSDLVFVEYSCSFGGGDRVILTEVLHRPSCGDRGHSDLPLSRDVTVYHEAFFHGKAFLCYGGTVPAVYSHITGRTFTACVCLVPLPANSNDFYLAGSILLRRHISDGKSTSEIYAGTRSG